MEKNADTDTRWKPADWRARLAGLLVLAVVSAGIHRRAWNDPMEGNSDELANLGAGTQVLRTGQWVSRTSLANPVLPLWVESVFMGGYEVDYSKLPAKPLEDTTARGRMLLDGTRAPAALLRYRSRLPFVLIFTAFVFWLFRWAERRGGSWAALFVVGTLFTTGWYLGTVPRNMADMPVSLTIALSAAALLWYRRRPALPRLAAVGILVGLALGSKLTAVVLLPAAGLLFLWDALGHSEAGVVRRLWHAALAASGRLAVVCAAAGGVVWGLYAFHVGTLADIERAMQGVGEDAPVECELDKLIPGISAMSIPAPLYWRSVQSSYGYNRDGQPVRFLGTERTHGVWYFFPVLTVLRSSVAFVPLVILILVAAMLLRSTAPLHLGSFGIPLLIFVLLAMRHNLNFGLRHFTVLMPLLALLSFALFSPDSPRPFVRVARVLVIWCVLFALLSLFGIRTNAVELLGLRGELPPDWFQVRYW